MERFRELDGLRGVAALAVVVSHYTGAFNSRYPEAPAPLFDFEQGAFGVQLFFMISGFVILLSAERASRPSDFVISRFSRLYPAYWASLAIAIVAVLAANVQGTLVTWGIALANVTMVQRWFLVENINDAYWTLAIEMQFYVAVFVLLLLTRCRLTDRLLTWASGIWLVVAVAISIWASPAAMGVDPQRVALPVRFMLNMTLAEFGPLFVFGVLAFLSRRAGKMHRLAPIAAVSAVLNAWLLHDLWYAFAVAVVVALFAVVVSRRQTRILLMKPIQWLGKISYSLYITHSIMGFALIQLLWPIVGRDVVAVLVAVVALVVAWGVWWLFEDKASRALRDWLLAARGRGDARRAASRERRAGAISG